MSNFTKSDLKNGDVVKLRNYEQGFKLVTGAEIPDQFISQGGLFLHLDSVEEDLTCINTKGCDIMLVCRPTNNKEMFKFDFTELNMVYERKEMPELTFDEAVDICYAYRHCAGTHCSDCPLYKYYTDFDIQCDEVKKMAEKRLGRK